MLENLIDEGDEARAPGCKAAKKVLVETKRDDEHRQQTLKAKQDVALSQLRRNELLAEQNELALFSIKPSADDEVGAQYLLLKKKLALAKLEAYINETK